MENQEINTETTTIEQLVVALFWHCGSAADIEDTLWRMLEGTIANPYNPSSIEDNATITFVYRRLKEALEGLQKALELTGLYPWPKKEEEA